VAVIESMKMHTEIAAPRDGVVDRVPVELGETFDQGAALVTLLPLASGNDEKDGD
jgi:biotin carboxyl carrier protein